MTPTEIAALDRAFAVLATNHPYDYDSYEEDKAYLESAGATIEHVEPDKYGDDLRVWFGDRSRRCDRGYLWAVAKEVAGWVIEDAAPKLLDEVKRLRVVAAAVASREPTESVGYGDESYAQCIFDCVVLYHDSVKLGNSWHASDCPAVLAKELMGEDS